MKGGRAGQYSIRINDQWSLQMDYELDVAEGAIESKMEKEMITMSAAG